MQRRTAALTPPVPASLCLLRLSALGDVANVVPLIHTLRRYWPQTQLTWVVGVPQAKLIGGLAGVEWLVYDKAGGGAGRKSLRQALRGRRFDALCHLHAGWRANLASRSIAADLRLGYDRERTRDWQRLFVHRRIAKPAGRHVVDGYFAFLEALGLHERVLDWSLPVSDAARERARHLLPPGNRWLLICPGSSHRRRNWRAERYAAVADHGARLGLRTVLLGSDTAVERKLAAAIVTAARTPIINLVGQTALEWLVALLARGSLLVTPDSGPAHLSNAVGLPTIALHAATDPARSSPYLSRQWCVDRFDAAARHYCGKPGSALPWGSKIERRGVMDLIDVADVTERLDALLAAGLPRTGTIPAPE